MKSKNLKTKLFTTMLTTMLIAPTILGATPLANGTVFEPVVAYANQMGANFNWTINKDTGNHGSEASAKTQTVQTSDGVNVTVYLYEQSIGTLTVRYGETGSISTFSGGQVPTVKGNHNVFIGDLGEIGSTDTISVNINVDEYTAPIPKPNAPTNVVISQDGTYISANADANSRVIVIDGQGNEIGYSADASYVELSRPLKANETVSVVAEDRNTGMRSDVVYVTFQETIKEVSMLVYSFDENGTQIGQPVTVKGQEGTVISVDAPVHEGYDLISQSPQIVSVLDGGTIAFDYKKKDVKPVEEFATLTTKFVDEKGTEISKSATEEFLVGGTYKAVAKQIEGYTLVDSVSETTGTMVKGGTTETFTYKKNEVTPPIEQKATLTTKFTDEKGTEIAKSVTEEVVIGKGYTAKALTIEGYTVVGTGVKDGVMIQAGKTETFVYSKDEAVNPIEEKTLTIKYVDESMNELKAAKTETHEKGSKVVVLADKIVGYTPLVNSIEVVIDDNPTATFIYRKDIVKPEKPANASNLKFVEGTNGTVISADVPVDTMLKILFNGEIIGESNVSGNINLSQRIKTGQEVEYFTVNSKGTESEVAKLVRADNDIEEAKVEKSYLEALVEETYTIDLDAYTNETTDSVYFYLIEAEVVLADVNATQKEVDDAFDNLANALDNLILKDEETPIDPINPIKPTDPTEKGNGNSDNSNVSQAKDGKEENKESSKKADTSNKSSGKSKEALPQTGETKGLFGILAGSTLLTSVLFLRFRRR